MTVAINGYKLPEKVIDDVLFLNQTSKDKKVEGAALLCQNSKISMDEFYFGSNNKVGIKGLKCPLPTEEVGTFHTHLSDTSEASTADKIVFLKRTLDFDKIKQRVDCIVGSDGVTCYYVPHQIRETANSYTKGPTSVNLLFNMNQVVEQSMKRYDKDIAPVQDAWDKAGKCDTRFITRDYISSLAWINVAIEPYLPSKKVSTNDFFHEREVNI
jgi:hypothetical protein